MVREITIKQVEDYLRCPLYYRYYYEFGLISKRFDAQKLLLLSTQRAVRTWFDSLGKGNTLLEARNRVGRTLRWLWSKDGGDSFSFPLAHARIMNCLIVMGNYFNIRNDGIIGSTVEATVAVDNTLFKDIIDGIFIKNYNNRGVKKKDKYIVAVQVVDKNNKLSPRIAQLRRGMVRYSINSAIRPNPYRIKLLHISLPDATKTWYTTDKSVYPSFRHLAKSIVAHLNSKLFLPTIDPQICRNCEYLAVCENKFCDPSITPRQVEKLKAKFRRSPQS